MNSTSGISIDQTGPSGSTSSIRMRGGSPHYVKILIDGIDVTKTSAPQSTPYLEKFMLRDFERIEVLKGNQSSLYGSQAIAGVVSLTTKKPSKDGFANKHQDDRELYVKVLPKKLDEEVASLMVKGFGGTLTKLTKQQQDYISVDEDGPFKGDSYSY